MSDTEKIVASMLEIVGDVAHFRGLYDAVVKERDALKAEVETVREVSGNRLDLWTKAEKKLDIAREALKDIGRGQGLKPSGMSTPPVAYSRDSLRMKAEDALARIQ